MKARIQLSHGEVLADLSRPASLARPVDFSRQEPQPFGAPPASTRPLAVPGFSGSVATGASCNCATITITPHCNGTHTECVGHLTVEAVDAWRVIPAGLLPALLITVEPVNAEESVETTEPKPRPEDSLITGHAIARRWPAPGLFEPRALAIRTRRPEPARRSAPYLSREAAQLLVTRGIEHLVVDLPSLDREQDEGRLTAHRVFFGLPGGSRALAESKRPACTVTELASIPEALADGWYLLELQAPAIAGDAVPSRPLLYPVQTA